MKKLLTSFGLLGLLLTSCQKQSLETNDLQSNQTQTITQRKCGSMEVLDRQLKEDPSLASRMESFEQTVQRNLQNHVQARLVNGVITIPVVVNVIYNIV